MASLVTSASFVVDGPAQPSSNGASSDNGINGSTATSSGSHLGLPAEALHPKQPWHKRRPSQILFDSSPIVAETKRNGKVRDIDEDGVEATPGEDVASNDDGIRVCQPGNDEFCVVVTGIVVGEDKVFIVDEAKQKVRFNSGLLHDVKVNFECDNFEFVFDAAYDTNIPQVFEDCVRPIVEATVERGINGSVLGYGQTTPNKFSTMIGDIHSPPHYGMMPAALSRVFDLIRRKNLGYQVSLTILEIYNDKVFDLLDDISPVKKPLNLRELRGEFFAEGATEVIVPDFEKAVECLSTVARVSSPSQSHYLLTITVTRTPSKLTSPLLASSVAGPGGLPNVSKISLINLSGSERPEVSYADRLSLTGGTQSPLSATGSTKAAQSLVALDTVITAINEGQRRLHIPYRSSALTRMLKATTQPNMHTLMIATISSDGPNARETLATLRYAARCKQSAKPPRPSIQRNASNGDEDESERERLERERLDREARDRRNAEDGRARGEAEARAAEAREEAERLRFQKEKEAEELRNRMNDTEERCRNAETRAKDLEAMMIKWDEEKKRKDEEFNRLFDTYKKTQTALVSKTAEIEQADRATQHLRNQIAELLAFKERASVWSITMINEAKGERMDTDTIVFSLEKITIKTPNRYVQPYITMSVVDEKGLKVSKEANTPYCTHDENNLIFEFIAHIGAPPRGSGKQPMTIFFELKHFKSKTTKDSTKLFGFIEYDSLDLTQNKSYDIQLYRKPTDVLRKKLTPSAGCRLYFKVKKNTRE